MQGQYSVERLLEKSPTVMIHSYVHGTQGVPTKDDIRKRKGWEGLSFVREDRIYLIDADLVTRAGPRVVEGLEELARDIYPELFK